MPVVFGKVQQLSVNRTNDGTPKEMRLLRDGAQIFAPWIQALVFEGIVFGSQAGSVTTPIAGHTAIDADQPEMAVRVTTDALSVLPIYLCCSLETGSTTLGVGGAMFAVSNIDVGAGNGTTTTPLNQNMGSSTAASAVFAHTYSSNGTDPLTAGNFQEIGRQGWILDSDAATSGFMVPSLRLSAMEMAMPLVQNTGSILGYAEHANNAPSVYFEALWAEFAKASFQ